MMNGELAWKQRNRNMVGLWEPLHELGFFLEDEHGTRADLDVSLDRRILKLRRARRRLEFHRRIGFFTHSLVGNAIAVLVGDEKKCLAYEGRTVSFDTILGQPNRHYLANAVPFDLGETVLVRHGATEANVRGVALGRSNGGEGWRGDIVESVSGDLPHGVTAWYCSGLRRTRQTAEMLGVFDAHSCAALDEMDIGTAEGIPEMDVIRSLVSAQLMFFHGDPFAAIVDELGGCSGREAGECFVHLLLRVSRCLEEIAANTTATKSVANLEPGRSCDLRGS